jgi:arylsulfatase A-like enzyme
MKRKPNVLLMMCDQLNASVLSCYGGPVPTPNLDRIANKGVIFHNAICPTPFCSPSRASMINGLYPHTHGIVHNVSRNDYSPAPLGTEEGIKADDTTTEKLLYEQGYETHHYGKWHLMEEELPYYSDMFRENHEYVQNMSAVFEEIRKRPRDTWMNWYNWSLPVEVSEPLKKAVEEMSIQISSA